ncbi:hypothetical protein OMK64_10480 [Cellulomonas fimi]|uniref:hypothetical protein n=1 Tax=Cellulomonas fimi TaxID=1708 RepID=UPI00234DABE3|nr:hypothetical protein [Cellulomonas fimi]MDC7121962.1 hypothetical protein [Cellulomonas fimi]
MRPSFGKPSTRPVRAVAAASAAAGASGEPGASTDGPTGGGGGRPRWLLPAVIGAVVVVVAAVVVGILMSRNTDGDAPPPVASTVLLPSPTPTIQPAARTATTAFATALPTTVLQYALTSSAPDDEWLAAGAVEAYTETFGDGADGEALVRAGQWETPEEASAVAAGLVAALPTTAAEPSPSASAGTGDQSLPMTGEVVAGGTPAGSFTVVDAGDGTGVAVWTNGSSVFRVVAPVEDIADFYAAFPL